MIKILQISDLHFVNDADGNNFKKLLLSTAKSEFSSLPEDKKILIITGDFHFYNEKNYNVSEEFIKELVNAMGIDIEQDVFLIPGNHDICLSTSKNLSVGQRNTVTAVQSDISLLQDNDNVKVLISRFKKFDKFCFRLGVYHNDGNPSAVHIRNWRNKLNFVHLNTCLVADGKSKSNQLLDTKTLTDLESDNDLPSIILGHNSYFDLHKDVQTQAEPAFIRLDARAYLCGDRHKFEKDRYQYDIKLEQSRESDLTIPNIVCCRSSADVSDKFSDVGCIIHEWDETTGMVSFNILSWDSKYEQSKFQSQHEKDAYNLSICNSNKSSAKQGHKKTSKAKSNNSDSVVLKKYNKYIMESCTELDLNGLPVEDPTRRYKLDRIFVPLRFKIKAKNKMPYNDFTAYNLRRSTGKDALESLSPSSYKNKQSSSNSFEELIREIDKQIAELERKENSEDENAKCENRQERPYLPEKNQDGDVEIDKLIPDTSRFRYLILADPGAGKTTFLKRIATAYCFPKQYLNKSGLTKRKLFPIWIRCRDITDISDKEYSIKKEIQSIPEKAEMSLEDDLAESFFSLAKHHIEKGTALLLIDGLDEIGSEKDRERFVEHLKNFIINNPRLNVIITSREKGFSIVSNGSFDNFTTLTIADLNDFEIKEICSNWFSIVHGESDRVKKNRDELVNGIKTDKRIRQLAKNPLLLTTLLLVNFKNNQFPSKRAGLYNEATKVLLETWNSNYHDANRIDSDQAKYRLAYVAFYMMTNYKKYQNRIIESELKSLLNDVSVECTRFVSENYSVNEIIETIQQRSALIAKTGTVKMDDGHTEAVYEFMHPTFQEYLAAYAACVGCYPGVTNKNTQGRVLKKYLLDENMKEVILLAAAINTDCAANLSDAVYKKIAKVNNESEKNNLRMILLSFFADEAGIDAKHYNEYFEAILGDGIRRSHISLLRQIVTGRYKHNLNDYFVKVDIENNGGYDDWASITEIISGDISNPIEYYQKNRCSEDDKLRAKAYSVLTNGLFLKTLDFSNENPKVVKQITEDALSILCDNNRRLALAGFSLLRMGDCVNSSKYLSNYLNCLCKYINRYKRVPSIIQLQSVVRSIKNNISIDIFLDSDSVSAICEDIKDDIPYKINHYYEKLVLLLTVSLCSKDDEQITNAYSIVLNERKNSIKSVSVSNEIKLLEFFEKVICSSKTATDNSKKSIKDFRRDVLKMYPKTFIDFLNFMNK